VGEGATGDVWRVVDTEAGCVVAVKIVRPHLAVHERFLARFSREVALAGSVVHPHVVAVRDWGTLSDGRPWVAMDYADQGSLADALEQGMEPSEALPLLMQVLDALAHLHALGLVHQDLKPENILLVHPRQNLIKLIDFGSSCHTGEKIYQYIQSRFYRSPEVLMGVSYSQPIDMWSLGCILVELHTGNPLFGGKDEEDQMFKIVDVLGMPPVSMLLRGTKCGKFFVKNTQGNYDRKPPKDLTRRYGPRKLSTVLGVDMGGPQGRWRSKPGHTRADYDLFLDLIDKLLVFDPSKRLTPHQAKDHPFFAVEEPSSTTLVASSSSSSSSSASRTSGKPSSRPSSAGPTVSAAKAAASKPFDAAAAKAAVAAALAAVASTHTTSSVTTATATTSTPGSGGVKTRNASARAAAAAAAAAADASPMETQF
jgi:dual specificity tyrosine-phosphorylation-regulated kinase 1